MTRNLGHAAVCALSLVTACSSPEPATDGTVPPAGASHAEAPTPTAGVAAGETTCDVKLSTQRSTVVRNLAAVGLRFTALTSGTGCSMEIKGAKRDIDCKAPLALNGTDFGVGLHEVTLRVATGPTGPKECKKAFRVEAPSPCHYTYQTPTVRAETDYQFDEIGRNLAEVQTYVAGTFGQYITNYAYDGESSRLVNQITSFSNVPNIPNTRKDVVKRTYVKGPVDALGESGDLVKTLDFDYLSDGKIDVRQTYSYDEKGRTTTIDQDNGADGTIDSRFTHEYDEQGRLKARQDDTNADGKIDDTLTYTFDALGVLQGFSTKVGAATWTFQYACK